MNKRTRKLKSRLVIAETRGAKDRQSAQGHYREYKRILVNWSNALSNEQQLYKEVGQLRRELEIARNMIKDFQRGKANPQLAPEYPL